MQRREIVGVQYLRGIAASAVVFYHVAGTARLAKYFGKSSFFDSFELGQRGVDLFFLLSGFIIVVSSLQARTLEPMTSRRLFLLRRFARIVPLMWVAVIGFAALQLFGQGSLDFAAMLRGLTLFPGPMNPDVLWTLRHELIFYTAFAFSYLKSGRGAEGAVWILPIWLLLPFVFAAVDIPADEGSVGIQALRVVSHPINIEFGFGLAAGLLWSRSENHFSIDLKINPFLPMCLLFLMLIYAPLALGFTTRSLGGVLVISALLTPLLLLGIHAHCPAGLTDRIGRVLGDASFAIYLFHRLLLSPIFTLWAKIAPNTPDEFVVSGGVLVVTSVGVLAHFYLEKPLVRVVQKLIIK